MPVWDLPEGDEMDTHPGVRSLTRTRHTATACLGMCVRPHKIGTFWSLWRAETQVSYNKFCSNFKSTVGLNHSIIVYQNHRTNQPQWQNSERRDSTYYAYLYQSPTSCTAHYIYISCSSATIKLERHKILKAVGVMQKSGGTLNHL